MTPTKLRMNFHDSKFNPRTNLQVAIQEQQHDLKNKGCVTMWPCHLH
jgi:hypothetical protein